MGRIQRSTERTLVLCALCVASLGLALLAASSAVAFSPLSWSAPALIAHQQPWGSGFPDAVSCPSTGLCVAVDKVGNVLTSTDPTGGTAAWTVTKVDPSRNIAGVSCPSIEFCVAVDQHGNLLTSINPTGGAAAWTVTSIAGIESFEGVSCPSSGLCIAVDDKGNIVTSTDPAGGAEAWIVTHVDDNTFGFSRDVSCSSATFCAAIDKQGNFVSSSEPAGGGAAWHLTTALNSLNEDVDSFRGLSCVSATFCVAVGGKQNVIATSTNPTGGAEAWAASNIEAVHRIEGVSCPSINLCVAGDQTGDVVTSINPGGGANTWTVTSIDGENDIEGLSCPSTGLCVAVDSNGSILTSTNPTGGAGAWNKIDVDGTNELSDVTCPSTKLCVAVGGAGNILTSTNPAGGTTAWTMINVPGITALNGVSCPSTLLCVAVGGGIIATSTNPTGGAAAWNVAAIESLGSLQEVSCASPTLCVVVDARGHVITSTNPTGGATAWTATFVDEVAGHHENPAGFGRYHDLSGLSCPSTTLCVAGDREGNFLTSTDPTGGTSAWTLTDVENIQPPISVSCPASGLCVGVNYSRDILTSTDPPGGATTWAVTPNVDNQSSLYRVSCASATFCIAVDAEGNVVTSVNPTGGATAWSLTKVAEPNGRGIHLKGVSCPSASLCVIVDDEGHAIVGTEAKPPVNTSLPTVSGSAVVGHVLDCSQGSWSGSAPQAYTYQWSRDGANISGANTSTYTVQTADQGHRLACTVTTTNVAGQTSVTSISVCVSAAGAANASGGGKLEPNAGNVGNGLIAGLGVGVVRPENIRVSMAGSIFVRPDGILVPLRCTAMLGSCEPVTLELIVIERLRKGRAIAMMTHHKSNLNQRTVVVGRSRITLRAGQNKTVKVPLNSRGRQLIALHKKTMTLLKIISLTVTFESQTVIFERRNLS